MKNWQPILGGLAAIMVALGGAVGLMVDGDAFTNPNWSAVLSAVLAGLTLMRTRQVNVTSEDSGAKTTSMTPSGSA